MMMNPGAAGNDEDVMLQEVIKASLAQKSSHDRNYEPIARVDQRLREKN